MATATLNLKMTPRRMVNVKEAAEYCGLPYKRFPLECRVPPVLMPSGQKLYDLRDLDGWIDGMKASMPGDDDDIVGRLG